LLAENHIQFALPESYLVFWMHQGYEAAWFALPKIAENPVVWFFTEGKSLKSPYPRGTFTDFILDYMQGLAPLLPTTRRK